MKDDIKKQKEYYLADRSDMVGLIPEGCRRVFDIGCAGGLLGKALKERSNVEVIGIEIDPYAAKEAGKYLDKVFTGDAESGDFPLEKNHFDCIICADIIEHMRDPDAFLQKYKKYLKKGGVLVLSIPNVQYYHVILSLLRGRWDYKDRGIFDRTHLRFFTLKSIRELLEGHGFRIDSVKRNYRLLEHLCAYQKTARIVSLGIFKNFLTFQYIVRAVKK